MIGYVTIGHNGIDAATVGNGSMLAFKAASRADVDACH